MLLSLGIKTTDGTSSAPSLEIITGSSSRVNVKEIGIFQSTANASVIGIGRPAAAGVDPDSPVDFLVHDEDVLSPASGTIQAATAWTTSAPTAPSQFLRRVSLPATVGTGVIFTFDNLIIQPSSSLVLWNIDASSVVDVYVVVEI